MEEHAALSVLHRWGEMNEFISGAIPLVPEHVEIRSLQSYSNPGLPQVLPQETHLRGAPARALTFLFLCLSLPLPGLPPHVGGHVPHGRSGSAHRGHQAPAACAVSVAVAEELGLAVGG